MADTTKPSAQATQDAAPARARLDWDAPHQYIYNGPATTFRVAAGAEPIGRGDTVSLTGKQVRLLMRSGHLFDADSQVGQLVIDASLQARRAERDRLEAEAVARKNAGQ